MLKDFDVKRTIFEGYSPILRSISTLSILTINYKEDLRFHKSAQIMMVDRGVVTCDAGGRRWLVPQQSGMWIPAGVEYSIRSTGELKLHCVYFDSGQTELLFTQCRTVGISALLRELILEMSKLPDRIDVNDPDARLVRTMLDQLSKAPPGLFQLPMPSHPRICQIAECWVADPSDHTTIDGWARKVGMSERTLQRIMLKETGMNFCRWRRHVRLVLALQRIAEGRSVQDVAFHLGYNSPGTFVAMFRKALGKPPLKFFADHGTSFPPELWDYWRRGPVEIRPSRLN